MLSSLPNIQELVIEAQEYLVGREDRLTNARRLALVASAPGGDVEFTSLPPNLNHRNSLTNDPFPRGENTLSHLQPGADAPRCVNDTFLFLSSG